MTKEFFYLLNETMKNDILLIIAKQDEKVIAGALNFVSKNTLYGNSSYCTSFHRIGLLLGKSNHLHKYKRNSRSAMMWSYRT